MSELYEATYTLTEEQITQIAKEIGLRIEAGPIWRSDVEDIIKAHGERRVRERAAR